MSNLSSLITVEEARQLQKNWINSRATDIENARGKEDVCEFLFSVDELQKFIDYIKKNSASVNPGIRIYLAAYQNHNKDEATVFMAPTQGVHLGSENDYDLQPLNRAVNGWPPKNY